MILLAIVLSEATKKKPPPQITKQPAIKSFLYYPGKVEKVAIDNKPAELVAEKKKQDQILSAPKADEEMTTAEKVPSVAKKTISATDNEVPHHTIPIPAPKPIPVPRKLDSFTQLQRLRSRLNRSAIEPASNPYQSYQPPSAFNATPKTVPHAVPEKDQEMQREQNTKNIGAGIAITKNEDGTCSVTQDMSAYGLSEGSSIQYFDCGESKFDKSFREHMKKVQKKLGK